MIVSILAVIWTGLVTLTDNVSEDVELSGNVRVSVAKGSAYAISGVVSGSGKLTLVDGGTLTLASDNTFTGGVYVDTGILQVTTGGALGTGDVTIRGSTTEDSQLQFGQLDPGSKAKTITFNNNITIENSGNIDHYQLVFGPNAVASGDRQSLALTGNISCEGDIYFRYNCTYSAVGSGISISFGNITANLLHIRKAAINTYFNGVVNVGTITSSDGGTASFTFYNSNNCIGRIATPKFRIIGSAVNAFGGAAIDCTEYDNSDNGYITLNYSQKIAYLKDTTTAKENCPIRVPAKKNSTLTITGGVEVATFAGALTNKVDASDAILNLKLDAGNDDFVQNFVKNPHNIRGKVTVNNGTLKYSDGATLCDTPTIEVNGGAFIMNTEVEKSLKSLTSLTVKSGATFKVARADAFEAPLNLVLEAGAVLDIPEVESLEVATLTYNGIQWKAGTYTSDEINELPAGISLVVTTGNWGSALRTLEWNGAGSDSLTTTKANWNVDAEDSVDTRFGTIKVNVTSGNGITYKDGDWFSSIVNNMMLPIDGGVATPFILASENEGDKLHLTRSITSDTGASQLVLRGHIVGPANAEALTGVDYVATYIGGSANNAIPIPESGVYYSESTFGSKTAPLALDGVTLDVPVTVNTSIGGITMFARAGTHNVLNRSMYLGYSAAIAADSNAEIVFNGKVTFANSYQLLGPGKFVFNNDTAFRVPKGLTISSSYVVMGSKDNVVEGANQREGIVFSSGTLEFTEDNAFVDTTQIFAGNSRNTVMNLNGTSQRFGRFNYTSSATGSLITSEQPSKVEVTCKVRPGANNEFVKASICSVKVRGDVSFSLLDSESDDVFTLKGRAFESTGDLEAVSGTLVLDATATWLNGSKFIARGTGTLRFAGSRQVSKDNAKLIIADDGMVDLANGSTISFVECIVNGVEIPAGRYTYETAPAALKAHLVETTATIRIGKLGAAVIIR